jgi:hypothetical protein
MNNTLLMNLINTIYDIGCLKCWIINFLIISFSVWANQLFDCCQPMIETYLFLTMPIYTTFRGSPKETTGSTPPLTFFYLDKKNKGGEKIQGYNRIGPHSIEIISIIFGSLLGGGHAERIKNGPLTFFYLDKKKQGTRVAFFQEAMHVKYLL